MPVDKRKSKSKVAKTKDKITPVLCTCGATPADVKARGLGVCYFCLKCSNRGLWQKNRDTAILSWNTEIQEVRHSRR